jgi:hypothetical protein
MNNKKKLQVLFFVLLAVGIALTPFRETRPFGFLFLCVIQPIIALYYISLFKQTECVETNGLQLRIPFLILLQITFVSFCFQRLFRSMHWPFGGPMNVLSFALAIITLFFGLFYIILNRKVLKSVFVFEFAMLAMPVLLFVGIYLPTHYSTTQYSEALNKQYQDLNQIEHTLYLSAKKDTLFDFTTVDFISQEKAHAIERSGGVEEGGGIVGGLYSFYIEDIEWKFNRNKKGELIDKIKREHPETVIEYLNVLTKLQIDLLLKEKK